jgi:hypothetical protein
MWLIFQLLVMFAVAAGIIYFDSQTGGATGGPAMGLLGVGAAYLLTWLAFQALDWRYRRKTKLRNERTSLTLR